MDTGAPPPPPPVAPEMPPPPTPGVPPPPPPEDEDEYELVGAVYESEEGQHHENLQVIGNANVKDIDFGAMNSKIY